MADRNSECRPSFIRRSCCFCVNLAVNLTLGTLFAGIAAMYFLPQDNKMYQMAFRAFHFLHRFANYSPTMVTPGALFKSLATQLHMVGLEKIAIQAELVSKWPHLETVFLPSIIICVSIATILLIKSMVLYKRDLDFEATAGKQIFCSNKMTVDQFNNKAPTYIAVAELMNSPEFKALKASRENMGSEAWNWQKRTKEEVTEDDLSQEDTNSDEEPSDVEE